MTTEEIIIHIFCSVDDEMGKVEKVSQADLYPSEVVTIGILFALVVGEIRELASVKNDVPGYDR